MCVWFFFCMATINAIFAIRNFLDGYLNLKLMLGWLLGIRLVDLCKVWKKMIEYTIFFFLNFVQKGNLGFL